MPGSEHKPKALTVPVKDLQSTDNRTDIDTDGEAKIEQLDDRAFKYRVELVNRDGHRLKISHGAIEELVFTNSIFNWWTEGYLIYKNPKDWSERQSAESEDSLGTEMTTWRFRGDGRDYIRIYLDPITDQDPNKNLMVPGFEVPVYTIKLFCCIYEVEDISVNEGDGKKSKKISFWDQRYHAMQEKNSYWNTVDAATRKSDVGTFRQPASHLSNSQRSVSTGLAIQDLLETHLGEAEQGVPIEFEKDGEEITWDPGTTKIFHHAGGNETAADTLDYLLKCHNSSDSTKQQPCILQVSRDDKWSLLPFDEYYTRAYDKQLKQADGWLSEIFMIAGEGANEKNRIPPRPKTPRKGGDWYFNVYNEATNNVNDYEFTEMAYYDHPTSVAVHAYDHSSGQFVIHQEDGDISKAKQFFQSTVVDKAYGDTDSGAKAAMVLNKAKIENKAMTSVFAGSSSDRATALNIGRNETIKQMMYLGNAIKFNVKGMTNRQAGRLISVDRQSYYNETNYDSKILGCYFVTMVTHKITTEGYFNEIIGVKPYHFKDLKFNEEGAV